jgi:mannosyltransferase
MRGFSVHAWGVLIVILLGFALRLNQLTAVPFRGDEAFAVQYWAGIPLEQSLSTIATIEPHPPLTYATFHGWKLWIGEDNELALRLLPVLANLIGIPTLYALTLTLTKNRTMSLLVAFIWAIHPFQIWHAQDFRNYAIWSALSTQILYWGWRTLTHFNLRHIIIYALVGLVSALTFYFELLTLIALTLVGMGLLWQKSKRHALLWLIIHGVIGAIVAGVFIVLQGRLFGGGGYGGNTAPFDPSLLITSFLPAFWFGETLPSEIHLWVGLGILGLSVLALGILWQKKPKMALFLGMLVLIPIILLSVISLRVSVFTPRYAMSAIPALVLLTLIGLSLPQAKLWRGFTIILGVIMVGLSALSLNQSWTNPIYRKAPDWYAVRDYFQERLTPQDYVIQTAVDAAFGYYLNAPNQETALPYNPAQSNQEIISILNNITETHPSIWLFEHSRQTWNNADVALNWLNENLQVVRETNLMGKPLKQFMPYEVIASEIQNQSVVNFEDVVALVGYQTFAPEPNGDLTVWVYWQPSTQTPQDYQFSLQVIGAMNPSTNSPLWLQDDQLPQNGRLSSTTWAIGTVYREVFQLPINKLPAGEYTLIVKVYDPTTGKVLTIQDAEFHTLQSFTQN